MSDDATLRQLVDADLACLPPNGAPITLARLLARRRRLARRRALRLVGLLVPLAPLLWWNTAFAAPPVPDDEPRAGFASSFASDVATMTARLDQLIATATGATAPSAVPRDAARRLRLERAIARAAALPDLPPTDAAGPGAAEPAAAEHR